MEGNNINSNNNQPIPSVATVPTHHPIPNVNSVPTFPEVAQNTNQAPVQQPIQNIAVPAQQPIQNIEFPAQNVNNIAQPMPAPGVQMNSQMQMSGMQPQMNVPNQQMNVPNQQMNVQMSAMQPQMNVPNQQMNPQMQMNGMQQNQGVTSSFFDAERSDDDYVMDYIGNNADKIMRKKFNFSAFFFGYAYFFFRKNYILGIIGILEYYVIPILIDKINLGVEFMCGILLVINILFAILFNKIYTNKARKEVEKVKSKNLGADSYTISSMLRNKGGTSFAFFIVGCVLFGLPQMLGIKSPLFSVSLTGTKTPGTVVSEDGTMTFTPAEGVTVLGNVELDKLVLINIPSEFKEGIMHDSKSYDYEYSFNDDYSLCSSYSCNECSIGLKTVLGYSTANEFAEYQAKNNSAKVKEVSKNGIKWYYYDYDAFDVTQEYVTEKDGKIFVLTFEENKKGICKKYFDSTLDSFKFK